jgi:hypothetical protein
MYFLVPTVLVVMRIAPLERRGTHSHVGTSLPLSLTVLSPIEYLVLNGKIIRSEQDKQTQERKYIIYGKTCEHVPAEVVVKIKQNVVIITVYIL